MKKKIDSIAVMLIIALLSACGGNDHKSGSPQPAAAVTIESATTFSVELTGVKVKDKDTGEIVVVDSAGINSGALMIQ